MRIEREEKEQREVEVRGKRPGQKERLNEVVACMAVGNTVSSSGVNVLPLH